MLAELAANAAVAARITGQTVSRALLREASAAVFGAAETTQTLKLAASGVRQSEQQAAQRNQAAARLEQAARPVRITPNSAGAADQALPRLRAGAGFSASDAPAGDASTPAGAFSADALPNGTDMAAISRFFERDARRYG